MKPLVSIIMPVYNASKYLEQAVQSALNQTYENIELIVVDDGSTDDSLSILKQIKDDRLRVYSQLNQGACVARNRGIGEAKGVFVKFLDSDDVLYPESIATQVEQMQTLAEDEVVFGDFDYMDSDGNVFLHNRIDEEGYNAQEQDEWLVFNWKMLISCPMHRKKLLEKMGGFDRHLHGSQESFLHFSMSIAGVKFVYKPGAIFCYRIHQDQDRISVQRILAKPLFWERVCYLDKMYSLVHQKYGSGASPYTNYLVQKYFDYGRRLYSFGANAEGKYCMEKSKEFPHTKKFPKYCGSSRLVPTYYRLLKLCGYKMTEKILDKVVRMMGKMPQETPDKSSIIYVPVDPN